MRKLVCSLVFFCCIGGNSIAMEKDAPKRVNQVVSYHLFSGSPSRISNEIPIETRSKLESDLSVYNERFQKAACTQLRFVANSLLDCYKKVFANDNNADENLDDIFLQEQRVFDDISVIEEASDKICEMCHGLPEAALRLESMYETLGLYKLALLWAHVSHKFGFSQAKKEASRLLLMM